MDFDNILDNNKSIEKTNQKSSELHLNLEKKSLNKDNSRIVSVRNGKVYIKNKEEHNNPEKSTPNIQTIPLKKSNNENTLKAYYSIHVPSPKTGSIDGKNVNTLDQGKKGVNNTVESNILEGSKTLQKGVKSNEFDGLEKKFKPATKIIEKDDQNYASGVCINIPKDLNKSLNHSHKADKEQEKSFPLVLEQTKGLKLSDSLVSRIEEYQKKIRNSDDTFEAFYDVNEEVCRDKSYTIDEACLVMQIVFHGLPIQAQKNINVINNTEALMHNLKAEKYRFDEGRLLIAYADHLGLDLSKPILGVFNPDGSCNIPSVMCRRGASEGGNLTFPKEDGSIPTPNELSIPFESNPMAEHYYGFDKNMYKKTIDIIRSNTLDLQDKTDELNNIIDIMMWVSKV